MYCNAKHIKTIILNGTSTVLTRFRSFDLVIYIFLPDMTHIPTWTRYQSFNKLTKSKKGHNCVKIWCRVVWLVQHSHLKMSNNCVEFQSNPMSGYWDMCMIEPCMHNFNQIFSQTRAISWTKFIQKWSYLTVWHPWRLEWSFKSKSLVVSEICPW